MTYFGNPVIYNWLRWLVFSGDFKGSLSWGGDMTVH